MSKRPDILCFIKVNKKHKRQYTTLEIFAKKGSKK